jgi:hypothetical protein
MSFIRWLENLENMDRRILYGVMCVLLCIPIIRPLGLPIPVSATTGAVYKAVEGLPDGSIVLFVSEMTPNVAPETEAGAVAMIKHLIRKNVRIIFDPTLPDAPRFVLGYANLCKSLGYVEGEDYVVLPFMAGKETLIAAIGHDFKSIYKEQKPSLLWDSVSSIKDVALVIDFDSGLEVSYYVANINVLNRIPLVVAVPGVAYSNTLPFFASKNIAGVLAGLLGSAEYETLSRFPGVAVAGMDSQSLAHVWIVILILLGNLGSLVARTKRGKGVTPGGISQ